MVQRSLILAILASLGAFGCNAGTSNTQVRQPAPVTKETLSATRIIAQINKNAETIQSLQADPAIEVSDGKKSHNLRGQMRMEREKDFRLRIKMMSHDLADIGSNETGFWFWVKDEEKTENNLYVCDYEHVGSSRLSVAMQPEWIMEAMGLRVITPREAATIDARPGDLPGQLLLTQLRKGANGATFTKETLVNENSGQIIEHRLYSGAKKELLARASIKTSKPVILPSTSSGGEEITVTLPDHFVLEWVAEKFKLDITMSNPSVNPAFSKQQVAIFFTEPAIPGANRVDLAAVAPSSAAPSSFIHETMPRSGIRLGQPQAVSPSENATTSRSSSSRYTRSSQVENLPELPSDSIVVGPTVPQGSATDPAAVQTSTRGGWQRPGFGN